MVVEPIASQLRACFFGVVARIRRVSASPTGSCVGGEGGSDGAALGGLNWVFISLKSQGWKITDFAQGNGTRYRYSTVRVRSYKSAGKSVAVIHLSNK